MFHVIIGENILDGRKFLIRKFSNTVPGFCLPQLHELLLIHSEDEPLVVHDVIVDELGETYGESVSFANIDLPPMV